MKKTIKILINTILIFTLIFSGFKIYTKLSEYKKDVKTYEKIRVEKKDSKDSLEDLNPDFRFWLKVDSTNIDYPVVQTTNNNYYLDHDFYKQPSISGSIFLDYRSKQDSQNLIIYGHNMRNKTMFNNLLKFKDKDFFDQNNKIRIIKNGQEYVYEVFSVYTIDAGYDYLISNFDNEETFNKYIDDVKNKSLFKTNIDVNEGDQIVTLSTCSYEFDDARTVVHAKRIK